MRFQFSLILLSILIFSLSCRTTTQDQSSRSSSEIQQEETKEKSQSIVIPVSSLGDVSETRQQILQNSLEDELKEHFTLISQERFEEAQEKAFEQLEYEECTEDQCIMLIQEMLQVENVFHLQVIGEGSNTQLSLSWRTLDVNKKETDSCLDCDTFELDKKIQGLVGNLIGSSKELNFANKNVSPVLKNSNILSAVKHIHAINNDYIQLIFQIIKYETNSLNFKGVEFEIELHGYKKYGFTDIRMINITFDNIYFKSFDLNKIRECLLGKDWLMRNQGSNIYKFSLNLEKINVYQGKCILESLKSNERNIISEILTNMVSIVNSSISGENLNDYYSNTHRPKDNYWKDYGVNSENDFWLSIGKTIEEKSKKLYFQKNSN
jgi:hypothetical protein